MMGIKERILQPLINVSLEDLVPPGNFYRYLEAKLDLSFVRGLVAEHYFSTRWTVSEIPTFGC